MRMGLISNERVFELNAICGIEKFDWREIELGLIKVRAK